MKPGLDDLGDPAVDDRAGVDDDVRLAGGRARRLGARPADEADGLGGDQQVLALGDRQADHPEPEEDRDAPSGSHDPERLREVGERQAEQEAHQQADRAGQRRR